MCNLIARFWDVNAGKITIGGTDVRDFKLDSLMKNISMVFQSVYLFADTIENNIKFGCPDATHEQVVEAAKKACCHNFISALPDGYDTVISEGGGTLSGGEKQRISIARAMLKDAPIIILDEATSSVDPENEDELQRAIEALTHDKTIIMIAHRLKNRPQRRSDPCTGQRSYRPARHSCGADPAKGPVCRFCIGQTGGHRLEAGSVKEVQMKLHASGEDYLETILVLQKKLGMVRSVDVARHMEVSKPSVCNAVATLRDGGFLTMDEDHFLHLTDVGREVAEKIYERHCFFTEQLIAAGVDPRTAEADACRIEHIISDESFDRLKEAAEQE